MPTAAVPFATTWTLTACCLMTNISPEIAANVCGSETPPDLYPGGAGSIPFDDGTGFSPMDPIIHVWDREEETNRQRFQRLDDVVRMGIHASIDAGFALMEIRDNQLWRENGHCSWNDYCESILEMRRSHINRLISHAVICRELTMNHPPTAQDGMPILPPGESQSRPLKRIKDLKKRIKAWQLAVKRADGLPTAKIVMDVVNGLLSVDSPVKPHPSRMEQRLELINSLREAALSKGSWEQVVALINLLEKLESPKTHTKCNHKP
jgi:hypothetical protein